jgi:hypothetical protein
MESSHVKKEKEDNGKEGEMNLSRDLRKKEL